MIPARLGDARLASDLSHRLGEGPVWDAIRGELYWVDILDDTVFRGRLDADGWVSVVEAFRTDGHVSAVAVSPGGDLALAVGGSILRRSPDGATHEITEILPEADTHRRLNDAKPDPAGDLVVGSLAMVGESSTEILVRVERDGTLTPIDTDLTLSNGLCWSADGARMYSVDTLTGRVFVRSYDAATGAFGGRRVHIEVDDGFPDGMCIDADDHLWIAIWGRGEVRRFRPDGTCAGIVGVAAAQTTSVAFVGPRLDTLVITTASDGLSDVQRAERPLSGRLFTFRPDVGGQPVAPWRGAFDHSPERTS